MGSVISFKSDTLLTYCILHQPETLKTILSTQSNRQLQSDQNIRRLIIYMHSFIVKLQVLGLRLGVDFTFTLDINDNHNNNNNPHLNFFKGTVLGVKEQGSRVKG